MDRFQKCYCGMDVRDLCFSSRFYPLALILIQCKRHKLGSTDLVLNRGTRIFGMWGKDFKRKDPTATTLLHHFKRYHLCVASERIECFEELAKIVYYIAQRWD